MTAQVPIRRPERRSCSIRSRSFVTDALEPNDVDCVLLIGPGFPLDHEAGAELVQGLPFLDIDLVEQEGLDEMVEDLFSTDRHWKPKGMIEVIQWT